MDSCKITLPFPPSVDGLYGGGSKQKRFPSKRYKEWIAKCPELHERIYGIVHIEYKFFWPDKRRRDGQNYMKATTDYLVNNGVIEDDNWEIVTSENWTHGGVDKENPRVEITLTQRS